jgi:hypothetical protein
MNLIQTQRLSFDLSLDFSVSKSQHKTLKPAAYPLNFRAKKKRQRLSANNGCGRKARPRGE